MRLRLAVDAFLHYLSNIRNYSPKTVINYKSDLHIFMDFCHQQFELETLESLTRTHIEDFMVFTRQTLHNSSYATARKLRCLKSFCRFCISRNFIDVDPSQGISEPKIGRRLPVYLNTQEAQRLLQAADGKYQARDFAIMMVFLFCGLRVSELSNLNLTSIDLDTLTMTVIGKGDKERILPLVQEVAQAIETYLAVRPPTSDNALFLSYRKSRLSVRGIQKIVKDYALRIGVDKDISPHKLRHTCATLLYSEGSLLELQRMLGHESVATTQIYAHTNATQMRQLAEKNPLLKNISLSTKDKK